MEHNSIISSSYLYNLIDYYISNVVVKKSYKISFLKKNQGHSTEAQLNDFQSFITE